MAAIQERKKRDGSVSYRAQVRLKGHAPQVASFARKTDAKLWAQQTEAAIRQGQHFGTNEARRRTLGELIDRYAEQLQRSRLKSKKDQTRNLQWWKTQLGEKRLVDITPALLVEQRDKLSQGGPGGRPCSPATVNRYIASLSSAFSAAVRDWGWIDDSPVRKVRKLTEPRGRVRFLSDEERERLLNACRESENPYLYTVVVLALATGMRRSEILNLKWHDVDVQESRITLRDTKNGERRVVSLSSVTEELLRRLAAKQPPHAEHVFPSSRRRRFGRKYEDPIDIRNAWDRALGRAGIDDFRFHDLRHSAASYMAMNGASALEIADVLGHKTLAMVKRYSHLSEAHTKRVVSEMNEKIFGKQLESA